jgi:hypothetical protein
MIFYDTLNDYIDQEKQRLDVLSQANIPEVGVISSVFAPSLNQDKTTHRDDYLVTREVETLSVDAQGIMGDRHRCLSRPSTGRESSLYPRGTQIRQHRHLCIVSSSDCQVLSQKLKVEVTPQLLGANLLIDRIDGDTFSISDLPQGAHMLVTPEDAGESIKPPLATIVHVVQQRGCAFTGRTLAHHYGDPTLLKAFIAASVTHRGIICCIEYPVESEVILKAGQRIVFKFPTGMTV